MNNDLTGLAGQNIEYSLNIKMIQIPVLVILGQKPEYS